MSLVKEKPRVDCQFSTLTTADLRADSIGEMNRGIYSAASGMLAGQRALDAVTQNLANVSTTGYKRSNVMFNDALEREMFADGGNGAYLGKMGVGPEAKLEYSVLGEQGPITQTGNPLDLAINKPVGMFAVQTPAGVRYTRDGSFTLDAERRIVSKSGSQLLDEDRRPITVPEGDLQVDGNGIISITANGQTSSVGRIGVFDGDFKQVSGNLFEAGDATPAQQPNIRSRAIEGSNANPIESMIALIELNRSFELAQRSITQQDELTSRLVQSLSER